MTRVTLAAIACLVVGCGQAARTYYNDLDGAPAGGDGSSSGGDGTVPRSDAGEDAPEDAVGSEAADGVGGGQDGPGTDAGPDAMGDAGDGGGEAGRDGGDAGDGASSCGPLNTITNCTACGLACDTLTSSGATCNGTKCNYTGCVAGYANCNSAAPDTNGCETPTTTTSNCGGCGLACDTVTSVGATCNGTKCVYTGCVSGYANCNTSGADTNGCETPTNTTSNCGGCGLACDTSTSTPTGCNGTKCSYTCNPGYADCVTTAPDTNGCETRINTTANCGACGIACGTLNASTIGCNGSACTYTCNAGYSNCNAAGSNTTGCECHTPGCCGTSCQTVHNNGPGSIGLGQTWDDCVTLGTFNLTQATAACFAKFGSAGACVNGWQCGSNPNKVTQPVVCDGACTTCWAYGNLGGSWPTTAGTVTPCSCSATVDSLGNWN